MAPDPGRAPRRTDALSRDRIVDAAIAVLDAEGERGLTFRALTARLSTGAGAIYHHVANKDELLAATTDAVVDRVLAGVAATAEPEEAIRRVALGLFDAIDAHPWVGAQLARAPWHAAMLHVFEGIGTQLEALGVPRAAQFDAASALLSYVLGVAGQNAANARLARELGRTDRVEFLGGWADLDPAEHPFLHRISGQLLDHDDREQYLAGIDLLLAGIAAAR